mgnify:CR=1 FL=1
MHSPDMMFIKGIQFNCYALIYYITVTHAVNQL